MTSFFAPRDTGFLVVDGKRIHQGLDITTYCGDHVLAAHAGRVVAVGRRFAYQIGFIEPPDDFYAKVDRLGTLSYLPIVVVIDDGNGYRSMYVHLSEGLVKRGDMVKAGDEIGLEGMTGNATGCHLHYELVRMDGAWMKVAYGRVREDRYPAWQRERIDPLRVLSLKDKRAARFVPGIEPPRVSPGLGRPTAPQH
jgi:murein DD-endopeptidase MepM/ murein hydrolase activator NlpD